MMPSETNHVLMLRMFHRSGREQGGRKDSVIGKRKYKCMKFEEIMDEF